MFSVYKLVLFFLMCITLVASWRGTNSSEHLKLTRFSFNY